MSNADPTRRQAPPEAPGKALEGFGLSPETVVDLRRFVALLAEWQKAHNLVAPGTLAEVWTRHVADSLQLLAHTPDFREWVDLGSGAGFPGLVVAIASKGQAGKDGAERHFTLVESNQKKAAFLRAAIRETGANASVAAERVEAHAPKMAGQADIVSARALAPLAKLLELAAPYLHRGSVMLFPKGQDYVQEVEAAAQSFDFDVVEYKSATDSGGRVLAIGNLRPKRPRP
jgi:16S rRNA (guanine527-N7)-methyltransferase